MNKKHLSRGVTLTEVLFSAGIISLVMVGIIVIFVQTIDISKRIDYEYVATNMAKSRIERARSVMGSSGFDFLPDLTETDTLLDSDNAPNPNGDFRRSTSITTNYSGDSRLTRMDITVVYKYKNQWKEAEAIAATTVFVDI